MSPAEREKIIAELSSTVTAIRNALDEIADIMWQVQEDFQSDRRYLLSAAKRQYGRGQVSNLLLCIRVRSDRPLAPPSADWKRIEARGHRVLHAKTTIASKRRQLGPAGRVGSGVNIFSNTLAKNRKFGWRYQDLIRYAHVCEYELVKTTEAKLRPLRIRVAELTKTGTRALQSLYQHKRMLRIEADQGTVPAVLVKTIGAKTATPELPRIEKFVPQLRFPDRQPQPVWSIPTTISDHVADDALEPGSPPQLRRPV